MVLSELGVGQERHQESGAAACSRAYSEGSSETPGKLHPHRSRVSFPLLSEGILSEIAGALVTPVEELQGEAVEFSRSGSTRAWTYLILPEVAQIARHPTPSLH